MENKLIDLHFEWMETGVLHNKCGGLCSVLSNTEYRNTLALFKPTDSETSMMHGESAVFWGSGIYFGDEYTGDGNGNALYTPRRQSIVLLICAMHGEI